MSSQHLFLFQPLLVTLTENTLAKFIHVRIPEPTNNNFEKIDETSAIGKVEEFLKAA